MASGLVLVTGGARGIGAAIARRLAADGFAVAVNFAKDAKAAEATVGAIRAAGGKAEAFQADVGDPGAIPGLFEAAVAALGPLAGLVNNAGIGGATVRVDAQKADDLERLFRVNVVGLMLCCGEAVRRLSTKQGGAGGAIVNISSVAARLGGLNGLVPYAASKGAVESFTRGLAAEVGAEGIRVNAIAPGMVATDMTVPILGSPAVKDRILSTIPLGRIGEPEDIADAASWLMSRGAGFVTGSVVTVSGGR